MSIALENTTIPTLLEGLDKGSFSVLDLTITCINRIHHLNHKVHAVSQINPDAIAIAQQRDAERAQSAERARGRLHGIPILIKDMIHTTDRMSSTNGSRAFLDATPKFEATVIRHLRDAGAVLLGKATLTEWANFRNIAPSSGWSGVGGQCLGPYGPNHQPSGSSSGSAVSVALGMAPVAIGTETWGSLSSPANAASLVSIKPTIGLTSRHGAYHASTYQDTIGVLAQNVRDAAIVLSVIAGPDPEDPITISDPRDSSDVKKPESGFDFAAACTKDGLEGKRIAIPYHCYASEADEIILAAFRKAIEILKSLGAIVIETLDTDIAPETIPFPTLPWDMPVLQELHDNMAKSLADYATNPRSLHTLDDVIEYNKRDPLEENEKWGQDTFELARDTVQMHGGTESTAFQKGIAERFRVGKEISRFLDRTGCDMMFTPFRSINLAHLYGAPVVCVPLGFYPDDYPSHPKGKNQLTSCGPGLPFGAIFTGRRWDDYNLIGAAHAFVEATQVRQQGKPYYTSDIQLPLPKQ